MATIEQLLQSKGSNVITVPPASTVFDAAKLMNQYHIGSLVVSEGTNAVGIFTERDVMRRVVAGQLDPASTTVEKVMTTPVACASPKTLIDEAKAVMREKRIRHLPVVDDDNKLCGMVSIGDLNRAENEAKEETIRYMEQYLYHP